MSNQGHQRQVIVESAQFLLADAKRKHRGRSVWSGQRPIVSLTAYDEPGRLAAQ